MKIKEVNIPANQTKDLGPIKMTRLGQVVVLAGKNGSGKSRILQTIEAEMQTMPARSTRNASGAAINTENKTLQYNRERLEVLENQIAKTPQQIDEIASLKVKISNKVKSIEDHHNKLNYQRLTVENEKPGIHILRFVPKSLMLTSSAALPKKEILQKASMIDNPGMNNIHDLVYSKIDLIYERYFNTTHQDYISSYTPQEIKQAKDDLEKLQNIIKTFLGTEIGRNADGICTLFKIPVDKLKLSEGQKIILQFCLAIYAQESKLADMILLLDEPENHLHPKVLNDLIVKIKSSIPNGQLWIATHSVTLLSQFDPNEIYFVEDGLVQHAGKIPERVLESLIGSSEEVSKLQDFLNLPSQYATTRFAVESLLPPSVVMTPPHDAQNLQISEILNKQFKDDKLKVLDFGAGKGRLIANLAAIETQKKNRISESLDYVAYDKFATYKEECKAEIEAVYNDGNERYFTNLEEYLIKYGKNTVDVVVMCNVLHEIPTEDWIAIFKEGSLLNKALKDVGYLLIVEDMQLPYGEMAYKNGFLILDTLHIRTLFGDAEVIVAEDKGGRLKATLVKKKDLHKVNSQSLKLCVSEVMDSALEKISMLRDNSESGYSDGRLHGLYSQLVTNSMLILKKLE